MLRNYCRKIHSIGRIIHSLPRVLGLVLIAAALALSSTPALAQSDEDRKVEDGGIAASGWEGMVDNGSDASLDDARLAMKGEALHVMTGPNVTYWNPENVASGSYTVKARFSEPEYMNLNQHPHPYGIFIGGSDLGTENARYLYCAAYGNGSFIVRGFGPEPFQLNGRRAQQHDAVNKASGVGEPVSQEVVVTVGEENVSCAINGTTVATYDKSEVVGEGRLSSTDGVYGIRFGHNVEGLVEGLTLETED